MNTIKISTGAHIAQNIKAENLAIFVVPQVFIKHSMLHVDKAISSKLWSKTEHLNLGLELNPVYKQDHFCVDQVQMFQFGVIWGRC
jgi:hypothetical protein